MMLLAQQLVTSSPSGLSIASALLIMGFFLLLTWVSLTKARSPASASIWMFLMFFSLLWVMGFVSLRVVVILEIFLAIVSGLTLVVTSRY